MRRFFLFTCCLFFFCFQGLSQSGQYLIEYYFDTDPGYGNGFGLFVDGYAGYDEHELEISTDELTPGIHRLFVRIENIKTGQWGFSRSKLFYISQSLDLKIQGLEYFVDTDPGAGSATQLAFEPNQEVTLNFEVPTDGLENGEHTLFFRAKDQFDKWYVIDSRVFNIDPLCGIANSPDWSKVAIEYLCTNGVFSGLNLSSKEANSSVTRAELATIIFNAIGLNEDKGYASDFPSPYGDLQDKEAWYYKYAKNLLYLEYKDGKTPFDRNGYNFLPDSLITKAHATKVLVEAWNIGLAEGNLPYDDVDTNHEVYKYIVTANSNNIFKDAAFTNEFKPNESITWAEIALFVYNAITEKDKPEITQEDFFIPGNITPLTLSSPPSLSEGYFDYSGGVSFAIPGIGLPLVFAHSYNSFYHELPSQLNTGVNNSQTPLKPIGSGWSHSFNAYMLKLDGQEENEQWAVVWPDGAFHFYNEQEEGYSVQTLGVYDTLIKVSEGKFRVTTKGQINYIFEKIPGSLDAFPFVLTKISDRNDNTLSITYTLSENNGWYRISEVRGTTGRTLRFSYVSDSDLITSITDPSGRIILFEYDSKDNARANLIKYTDVKGNAENYDYTDLKGFKFLSKITFPDGNEINNDYYPLLRKLKSTENKYANSKLNLTHHFGYSEDEGDFNYSEFKDENNLNYTAKRNIAGRLTEFESQIGINTTKYDGGSVVLPSSLEGIDKVEALYEYDSRANVTKITLPSSIEQTFTYNDRNDVTSSIDPLGNTTTYTYDNASNLESIITAEGGETTFERLSNGLLKSVTSPEGITIRFEYDKYGNLIKTEAPEGIVSEAVFDILGRVEKQFNNAGQEYLFEYDKYDNTIATIDPLGYKTRYQFDQTTNDLDAIVNAKNKATNITYDNQNRLTKEEFEGNATSYDFDDLGFLDTYTDPSGHQFKMVYDDFRRLEDNGYSQITYDEKNNIETVKSPEGKTITYSYDDVLNRIKAISYEGETIGYEYDKVGNLTTLTYPDGKKVTYTYDKENRLKEVIDWADNKTIYTYLKDGRLATMTYPNDIKNIYQYDNAGRSLGFEVQKSDGSKFYSYSYILNPSGKHIQEDYDREIDQQFQQEEASISYQYNSANRIQKAGETTFDFDANGNTIRKGNTTFSYDLWNNLTHLSSPDTDTEISYTYDGLGNRRSKTENGQTTQYSLDILGMSRVLVEHLQEDKKNIYVYGLGLISRLDEDENASFYHYDFRGSTIALTDKDETVSHSYIYDVFGETLSSTEADYNPFRFVGKYGVMHETDDFYFMRARYYDASIGRFLSEDPIWSTNLYVYGGNDPVNRVDASGEFWDVLDVASFAYSSVEFIRDPSWTNAAFLAWDAVALLPVVPSSGVVRGALFLASKADNFKLLKHAKNYGIDTYKSLKKVTKGKGLEVHHLIEKRFSNIWGESSQLMKSVVLTVEEHKIFTKKWREAIPYKSKNLDWRNWMRNKSQLEEIARDIYKDYPQILKALGL
jgi:RHS repeat-associated protein